MQHPDGGARWRADHCVPRTCTDLCIRVAEAEVALELLLLARVLQATMAAEEGRLLQRGMQAGRAACGTARGAGCSWVPGPLLQLLGVALQLQAGAEGGVWVMALSQHVSAIWAPAGGAWEHACCHERKSEADQLQGCRYPSRPCICGSVHMSCWQRAVARVYNKRTTQHSFLRHAWSEPT